MIIIGGGGIRQKIYIKKKKSEKRKEGEKEMAKNANKAKK